MTLREAAARLRRIAEDVGHVRDDVLHGGAGIERWAIARDLESTCHSIRVASDVAERAKQAVAELRGCLLAYDRSREAVA